MRRPIRLLCLSVTAVFTLAATALGPGSATAVAHVARQQGTAEWSQRGFDATHRSLNALETVLSPANVSQLTVKWQQRAAASDSSPVEADGRLFVTSFADDVLRAFDATNGTILWTFSTGVQHTDINTPAVANGKVYVTINSYLYGLDAATGTKLWKRAVGVSNAVAFVIEQGSTTLYVAAGASVYAIDGDTGKVLWMQTPLPHIGMTVAPAVANGLVYVTDENMLVHGYDQTTGTETWTHQLPVGGLPTDAVVDGNILLIGKIGFRQFALDATTGSELWNQLVYVDSNAAVAGGVVYLETRRSFETPIGLIALDEATGAVLWHARIGNGRTSGLNAGPSVANGVVYATSLEGGVSAFDAASGVQLWTYSDTDTISGSPTVVDGTVYVSHFGHTVLAFGLPGGAGA